MDVLINLVVGIFLQYICLPNHNVHFKIYNFIYQLYSNKAEKVLSKRLAL